MKQFYRYVNGEDERGVYIWLQTYNLVRETPCYYIVRENPYWGKEIRVPKDPDSCKRIHHTKESAWHSFRIRQERRIYHAERNIKIAKKSIEYVENNPPLEMQYKPL